MTPPADLREALERIAAATATDDLPVCRWCGTDVSDRRETPGHKAACPTAIARAALAAVPSEDPELPMLTEEAKRQIARQHSEAPYRRRHSVHEIAVAFLRLPPTSRLEIARQLGVDDRLDDIDVRDRYREILRRVRVADEISALEALLFAPTPSPIAPQREPEER